MKYAWLLLTIILITLIFYNSSLPMSVSGKLSGMVANICSQGAQVFDIILEENLEYHIRKLAHFCEFAFLALLMCKTFSAFKIKESIADGYILLLCLFTAVLDEYIQLSVLGRCGRISDVLLDFSGVVCMWLAVRVWQRCR